jgi:hypothetical protein
MSDSEHEDIDFGNHDDEGWSAQATRRSRRRRQASAGAVGLAALIGGGVFVATEVMNDRSDLVATTSGSPASLAPPSVPYRRALSLGCLEGCAQRDGQLEIGRAGGTRRPQGRREGRRAASPARTTRPLSAADVTVTNSGSLRNGEPLLRVVLAQGDLTGQLERGMVGDAG